MPQRHTISSHCSKALRDNASRTIENPSIPSRVTEQVEAPPPIVEGIAQILSNWEILIEIQTRAAKIQV